MKTILRSKCIDNWYSSRAVYEDGKLCTYLKVKQNFGFEKYLNLINKFDIRKSITKLRISAHKLIIETGRYSKIPRADRLCNKCDANVLGDEIHFLLECSTFENERTKMLSVVDNKVNNFKTLNVNQKFIYLLSSENIEILSAVGSFICNNIN